MAARNKPYDQFGPYILFKKLEADALGDLWRAGRIDGDALTATVALRRMSGGSRDALGANAEAVSQILPRITGPSFVRDQHAGIIDGIPHLAWDYAGGRSLRYVIDRARGTRDAQPNPLPLDQAIVIAEKVALSLATMADLRDTSGARLCHGGLLPQFVWISDDGEIRVAGQQLGAGLVASLHDPKLSAELGRYFSPEYRNSGQAQKNTDVYSMGAILFLLVTGQEPPDASTASAFGAAVRAAKTMIGAPVPDDIRVILDKSFNIDPSMRYPTMAEMKQAISTLAHGGKYSATTFNLAFYLSNLLKKEMESEAVEREKEAKVNVAPYAEALKGGPAQVLPPTPVPAMFTAAEEQQAQKKSKLPLAIAAAVIVLALLGGGGYMMLNRPKPDPGAKPAAAQLVPPTTTAPRVISEPIVASASPQTSTAATATTGSADPEAQKKAFEEAVRQRMQAEMMKLQNDFMAELKQKQSKNAPVVASAPVVPISAPAPTEPARDERASITAAELDAQRRQETQVTETRAQAAPAPAQVTQTAPAPQPAAPAPAPVQQAPAIREGDVVDVASLDVMPRPVRPIRPVYPPIAARQKIRATIILSAFIDESGDVREVSVLRGDARFGLNDAAIRAMKNTKFTSPMKQGKRVRTWFPQTIEFVPN